ncbi:MAG: 2-oxoglutarate ferredoxin oxidoreductase subunit beta, partial [Schwartzia sp.]|nr:2-oxoglutarate ferredoxin oxidoreductase subunit beta [Schwartzia sp. (in: firmicutes)]
MKSMEELVNEYFRPNRLPHLWCPGCGNGVVLGALLKAIDAENLSKDDVAIISGIGCSSRASGYV